MYGGGGAGAGAGAGAQQQNPMAAFDDGGQNVRQADDGQFGSLIDDHDEMNPNMRDHLRNLANREKVMREREARAMASQQPQPTHPQPSSHMPGLQQEMHGL